MSPVEQAVDLQTYQSMKQLQQLQQESASAVREGDWDYWRVIPTCPPSTSITMLGARYIGLPSWGGGYSMWQQDITVDMTNIDDGDVDHEWVHAYWYIGAIVSWNWYGSEIFRCFGANCTNYLGGGFVEYETAAEAEASLDAFATSAINETGVPLCRAIFRNDGRTGEVLDEVTGDEIAPIMAIDPSPRGRSYLFGSFRKTYTI